MATPTTSGIFAANVFGDYAIDWSNDTFKMALFDSSWDPTLTSGLAYSSTNEVTGTGYTAGGKTVPLTINTSGQFLVTASDVVWSASTLSDVAFAALYDDTVSDLIVAIWVLAIAGANSGGNFTLNFPDSPATGTVIHVPGAS